MNSQGITKVTGYIIWETTQKLHGNPSNTYTTASLPKDNILITEHNVNTFYMDYLFSKAVSIQSVNSEVCLNSTRALSALIVKIHHESLMLQTSNHTPNLGVVTNSDINFITHIKPLPKLPNCHLQNKARNKRFTLCPSRT